MTCPECGLAQVDGFPHVCAVGHWATIRLPRSLYDLLNIRLEQIGLAIGSLDIGAEMTNAQRLQFLEIACTLLDTSAVNIRKWIESGERR